MALRGEVQWSLAAVDCLVFTVQVAPGARSASPSPLAGEGRGGGTAKAPAPFILRGGAGAMAVTSLIG